MRSPHLPRASRPPRLEIAQGIRKKKERPDPKIRAACGKLLQEIDSVEPYAYIRVVAAAESVRVGGRNRVTLETIGGDFFIFNSPAKKMLTQFRLVLRPWGRNSKSIELKMRPGVDSESRF